MKVVTLNRPALWRPIRSQETSVRKYSGAYPYKTKSGVIAQSSIANPVIRYAKNFTKFKLDFSLFIFTDETDLAKIEGFFADLAKKLKKSDITQTLMIASMSDFTYLDTYYGGRE